jgi:predicted RNA-binding Zn ribbon-like protein
MTGVNVDFANDAKVALQTVAALINTAEAEVDQLSTLADLDEFLKVHEFTGSRTHSMAELRAVRHLRSQLRSIWTASEEDAVRMVNSILRNSRALPQLVKHDHWDWHIHATTPQAPLEIRMAVEAAMALTDVIRSRELDRLRLCAAPDCSAVVLDLSRNRSKLYCDTGNCGNREHVKAYRQRRRAAAG